MIDINNQLLGRETGRVDLSAALALCEHSERNGVEELVVTMRMTKSAGTDAERARVFERNLRRLRARLAGESEIRLKLNGGYEWSLSDDLCQRLRGFEQHPAIGESNCLLISFPSLAVPVNYERALVEIVAQGYLPIISHPECSRVVRRNRSIIDELIKMGCLIQVDALSVMGGYTSEIGLFTRELLERGQVHFIATRAGQQHRREMSLNTAFEHASRVIGRGAAQALVRENPKAALANAMQIETRSRVIMKLAFETALHPRV
jgi:protein-tyrosine phosphatase